MSGRGEEDECLGHGGRGMGAVEPALWISACQGAPGLAGFGKGRASSHAPPLRNDQPANGCVGSTKGSR